MLPGSRRDLSDCGRTAPDETYRSCGPSVRRPRDAWCGPCIPSVTGPLRRPPTLRDPNAATGGVGVRSPAAGTVRHPVRRARTAAPRSAPVAAGAVDFFHARSGRAEGERQDPPGSRADSAASWGLAGWAGSARSGSAARSVDSRGPLALGLPHPGCSRLGVAVWSRSPEVDRVGCDRAGSRRAAAALAPARLRLEHAGRWALPMPTSLVSRVGRLDADRAAADLAARSLRSLDPCASAIRIPGRTGLRRRAIWRLRSGRCRGYAASRTTGHHQCAPRESDALGHRLRRYVFRRIDRRLPWPCRPGARRTRGRVCLRSRPGPGPPCSSSRSEPSALAGMPGLRRVCVTGDCLDYAARRCPRWGIAVRID